MLTIRRSEDRGGGSHGWLDTRHTFSFADYYDPDHMGFRTLRVLNDDRVAAGAGFPAHAHRDAEILSYVVDGALEHRDSMGNGSVIRRGEVQRLSAGTGIRHSEYNHSKTDPVRFLQIWLYPDRTGITPGYEQREFPEAGRRGTLRLVVSPDGRDDSLSIHQDARMFASLLEPGDEVRHEFDVGRHGWLQMIRGDVELNGETLHEGDGAAITDQSAIRIAATNAAELLLFDLA